jgi:hypothetical protein
MKDLIILVADQDIEFLIKGVLPRIHRSNHRIQKFSFDVFKHPGRDPGCLNEAHEFLRGFTNQYRNAMVVLDFEGAGDTEKKNRTGFERIIEKNLHKNGWNNDNSTAIVIAPECENWIWVKDQHLKPAINWKDSKTAIDSIEEHGFKTLNNKPVRPKEAFEYVLKQVNTPRSSSIFKKIAERASINQCTDPAFSKMIEKLTDWFGDNYRID